MSDDEAMSCGAELAASAEVPVALAALMSHVAINLNAHAVWVGTGSATAQREHDAMSRVAGEYRAIASAANRAAEVMRSFGGLEPVAHDPSRFDRAAFVEWMRQKVRLQRELADLLIAHAVQSEKALEAHS